MFVHQDPASEFPGSRFQKPVSEYLGYQLSRNHPDSRRDPGVQMCPLGPEPGFPDSHCVVLASHPAARYGWFI
jgi:hypothetical protein